MVARPRPKRGSGFAESMAIARRNAFFARPVLISASSAKPSTVCARASSGASSRAFLRRPPRPVAPALHQPQLGEPRPGQRVLRLVLDRLLHRLRAPPRSETAPARHRRGRSWRPPSGGSARPPVGHLPAPARGRSGPPRSPHSARRRGRRRDRASTPGRCRPAPPRPGRPTATPPRDRGSSRSRAPSPGSPRSARTPPAAGLAPPAEPRRAAAPASSCAEAPEGSASAGRIAG